MTIEELRLLLAVTLGGEIMVVWVKINRRQVAEKWTD